MVAPSDRRQHRLLLGRILSPGRRPGVPPAPLLRPDQVSRREGLALSSWEDAGQLVIAEDNLVIVVPEDLLRRKSEFAGYDGFFVAPPDIAPVAFDLRVIIMVKTAGIIPGFKPFNDLREVGERAAFFPIFKILGSGEPQVG